MTPTPSRRESRRVIFALVLAALVGACRTAAVAGHRPLNVILIVTDDQGIGDLSVTGNPVLRTPNLDRLAAGGARMTRFYVSPVCTPTRACLMTGRYNYRTRAIDTYVGRAMMDPAEVTVAEVLRDAGYATGIFGKWHLGDNYPVRAMDQGFTESLVIRGGGIGQPSDPPGGEGRYTDPILFHNGRQVQARGYCTDVFFDAAAEWIEKNNRQGRSFFAYIATNAPHEPLNDVPKDWYEHYRKMDLGPVLAGSKGRERPEQELEKLARIFAMIANIDDNVGKLIRRLETLGLLDNTMVIFLTDNGPGTRRYVGNLRGMKSEVYEGGIRAAFLVHGPRMVKAGALSDIPAAHIDVMPTILEACGVAAPEGLRFDGRSILPLLEGRGVNWPDRTIFIQSHRGDVPVPYHHFAAIGPRWKLLHASGFGKETLAGPPKFALYDIVADPAEQHDLAKQQPEIVGRLKQSYKAWFEDVGGTRPDNYAPPRIEVGTAYENPVVLTRQNWRREPGEQLHYGSNGTWLLQVAKEGSYSIRLRFPASDSDGKADIRIQDGQHTAPVAAGAAESSFQGVMLKPGPAELRATLMLGDQVGGPWQADISGP
ncbi:MAG TPA: arylsulfatase [Phycisphaerae bacterium]|nr:arylsulfatase [Phycisphaerae bacterium]HRY68715.1 arylsulfatase [Phycisphaerae bacterium]HSA25541.1 arylsulfatase [Phycisphaerae bacterium]